VTFAYKDLAKRMADSLLRLGQSKPQGWRRFLAALISPQPRERTADEHKTQNIHHRDTEDTEVRTGHFVKYDHREMNSSLALETKF
jgi:hypothetical protein